MNLMTTNRRWNKASKGVCDWYVPRRRYLHQYENVQVVVPKQRSLKYPKEVWAALGIHSDVMPSLKEALKHSEPRDGTLEEGRDKSSADTA